MASFEYTSRNCWEVFSSDADTKAMEALGARYVDFLSRCKTERETIEYAAEQLEKAGFSSKGAKIMRSFHGKALFVARKGKEPLSKGFRLVCAHSDAPRLDFKQRPLQEQCNIGQAKTHYYGGLRKYQWFARPLALHGVVVRDNGEVVRITLGEKEDEPVFTIADLLPHLAQAQATQTLSKAFEAEKMNVILAHKPLPNQTGSEAKKGKKAEKPASPVKSHILAMLNEKYGLVEEDLYSAEIQAVPAGPARYVGLDKALIGGYGQDDRICVFLALEAFLQSVRKTPAHTQILVFYDKEEIGSEGSASAKSRLLEYCVQDLLAAWEPGGRFSDTMLASKALSADVHAAIDPDWQELHEKMNSALIGHGPSFCKFTGHRGKYEANDAHAEYVGWLRGVMNTKNIPWQLASLGKVDGGGGGTVAMHLAAYGMDIIDCGPPILSMHSPFEVSSIADLYATYLAYQAFLTAR